MVTATTNRFVVVVVAVVVVVLSKDRNNNNNNSDRHQRVYGQGERRLDDVGGINGPPFELHR